MSTRKLGVALGAAVLLLGMPTSYALAGGEDRPGKPDKPPHQCEDGLDNDGAGDGTDYPNDPDCGSPRDNSESPEEGEEPGGEEPGGGLPALPADPAELQALIEELVGDLPPGGGEPPTPPADPAELQALIEEVVGDLPPGGGEPPTPPADPAELQALIEEVVGDLPPGGGEPPTPPALPVPGELPAPPTQEELVATVEGLLPDPPA